MNLLVADAKRPADAKRGMGPRRHWELSHPADASEREAERMSRRALQGSPPLRSCACGGGCPRCQGQAGKMLWRSAAPATPTRPVVPTAVDATLRRSGAPLDVAARAYMEPRFGHDFSGVRVHDDAGAAASAQAVQALAYTSGRHIVFNSGRYAPDSAAGRELLAHELAHVVQHEQGRAAGALQRYAHQDCSDSDLRAHVWPADGIAKRKVDMAIAALTASPVSAATEALLVKYFMSTTPDLAAIAAVYQGVKDAFDGNDYTYECEDDCDEGKAAYSGWAWDIHLCMNNIRGRANDCIARTIIHEFTHKYSGTGHGWYFSTARCYRGCDTSGCPAELTPSEALDNAYSYAGFAHEL